MLNFNRPNQKPDAKDGDRPPLRPAVYEPPPPRSNATAASLGASRTTPAGAASSDVGAPSGSSASGITVSGAPSVETPGSKLSVGVNIKLKGVEISDCDILVIEGQVEATVHSKAMQIAKPGTLKGTALIDVAEVHGDFSGELTARTRLIVHDTGRVSGTIRYGKLIVEEGGELSGDVKRIDSSDDTAHPARATTHARHVLGPEGQSGSH